MRRTVYILLFCLFMGYLACFSNLTENALAAPQVIKIHYVVSSSEKQTYDQYANKERISMMKQHLYRVSHSSKDWVGRASQSNFLQSAHASEASSQARYGFPSWSALKAFDISSLWKQQRDTQKKKDIYDFGE